jgi:fructokinase
MSHRGNIGAIEAGGTKIVCCVGASWQEIRDGEKLFVPTTSPEETMALVMDWFVARDAETPLAAIGVASFGPIDFASGSIAMSTPKQAWRGLSWRRHLGQRFGDVAVGLDTDTNAAGLAEWRWGAAQGRQVAAYITVGTGIGGALVVNGTPVHGLLHPEMGHMVVPRQRGDEFAGTCPTHGDCLEGLACGPAVAQRWNGSGHQLPPGHAAWELESAYLATAMVNIITIASPEVIVLGGGVMAVEGLLDQVRAKTRDLMRGYIDSKELAGGIDRYIVAPGLGSNSGVVGAFALGSMAALDARS